MRKGNWQQAIERWKRLLDHHGPSASSRIYSGLANAYIKKKDVRTAAAVVERGRALFPNAVDLPLVWAHIATVEEDWDEAVTRYRQILEAAGPTASWRPYKGLVTAFIELDDLSSASTAADEGMRHFPGNVDVVGAWARVPLQAEDWDEARLRWEHIVDQFGSSAPWRAYANLSLAYGKLGDLEMAWKAIDRGRSQYPDESILAGHAAELAMARRDWTPAINCWRALMEFRIGARGVAVRGELLPRRGLEWDWYEEAWQQIAHDWDCIEPGLSIKPDPLLFRSLARTMKHAQLPDEAQAMLEKGASRCPDDSWLEFDLALARVENLNIDGRARTARIATHGIEQHGRSERFLSNVYRGRMEDTDRTPVSADAAADPAAAVCAKNAEKLSLFHPSLQRASDGLGPVHIIRVPAGSSVELQLKAGRYFSPSAIERRVQGVSRRDRWDEMTSSADLLMGRARTAADALGGRFADPPHLTAETLSDAALFLLFQELSVYEPMRRIAADIAAENDDSPVFIESPVDSYRYLDGDPFTHFDVLFLYFELRQRGVNAFLCRILAGALPRVGPLRFVPGVQTLRPQGAVSGTPAARIERAVFPAGIRSVRRVGEAIGDAIVFSSGSVVKEFAYDRTLRQESPIDPDASVHPPFTTFPHLQFGMMSAAVLDGVPLIPEVGPAIEARVESSEALGHDWLFWVDQVLHAYFTEISMRSLAEVGARGIAEAHISDHLYPDAVLFGDAVKRSGGRVVLWPHSANPALINERRRASFDEAHAITRTGCERWKERFPDADVKHTPSVMLDPASRDAAFDPSLPLSVVVFGGRTVLRYMPELDQPRHESSYRAFFRGLGDLQKRHPIDLYFKPRGLTGEHEMWLSKTVGTDGNWRRVLEHPLRIDLPNPLFVSISMGTSALIEGLGRGIPALVVRDFPVRDYTTLNGEMMPIGTAPEMLGVIESLLEPGGYDRLLDGELEHYAAEVQIAGPG